MSVTQEIDTNEQGGFHVGLMSEVTPTMEWGEGVKCIKFLVQDSTNIIILIL